MPDPTIALTHQMLQWIATQPRTYAQVLDTWRTSCPQLSIWEDVCIDGLVEYDAVSRVVSLSPKGKTWLHERGN